MARKAPGTLPAWVELLITDVALVAPTISDLVEKYQRSRGVVEKWIRDPRVVQRVANKRIAYEDDLAKKLRYIGGLSYERLIELLAAPAPEGMYKLQVAQAKAALLVLRGKGDLVPKQEVEHTGGVHIYLPEKVAKGAPVERHVEAPAEAGVRTPEE